MELLPDQDTACYGSLLPLTALWARLPFRRTPLPVSRISRHPLSALETTPCSLARLWVSHRLYLLLHSPFLFLPFLLNMLKAYSEVWKLLLTLIHSDLVRGAYCILQLPCCVSVLWLL